LIDAIAAARRHRATFAMSMTKSMTLTMEPKPIEGRRLGNV
jgi:hypothetical protein